jgi:hypothetical protein
MTLGQTQRFFARIVGELIVYAYSIGYELTLGDAWAKTGHKQGSNHYIRLAIDLNLFKDGIYLAKGLDMERGHGLLHDKWDELGGGARIDEDLNHYSMEWNGSR